MSNVKKIVDKIVLSIFDNKPLDLWVEQLKWLQQKKYIAFILYIEEKYDSGVLINLCNELKECLEKNI